MEELWDPEGDRIFNEMIPLLADRSSSSVGQPPPIVNLEENMPNQPAQYPEPNASSSLNPPPAPVIDIDIEIDIDNNNDQNNDDINDDNSGINDDNNDANDDNNDDNNGRNNQLISIVDPLTLPPCQPAFRKRPGPRSLTDINPNLIYDITIPLIRIDEDNYAHVNEPGLHIVPRDGPLNQPSSSATSTSHDINPRKITPFKKSMLKPSNSDNIGKYYFPPGISNYLPFDNETTLTRSAKQALEFDPNASLGFAFAAKIAQVRNHQAGEHIKEERSPPYIHILPCPTAQIKNEDLPKLSPPTSRVYLQNASHYFGFVVSHSQAILKNTNRFDNRTLFNDIANYFSNVSIVGLKDFSYINLSPVLNKLGPGLAATQFILLYPNTGDSITKGLNIDDLNFPFPSNAKKLINLVPYSPIDVRSMRIRFNKVLVKWNGNYKEDQIYDTISNMIPNLFSFLTVKRDPNLATNYLIHLSHIESFYQLDENNDVINRSILSWPINNPNDVKSHSTTEILNHESYDVFPYRLTEREIYTKENPLNITSINTTQELKTNQWIALLNQSIIPRSWSLGPDYLLNHPAKLSFDQGEANPLDVPICI